MTISEDVDVMVAREELAVTEDAASRSLSWTAVILGALVAAALSSILLSFGATLGLGLSSTAPTWRDASAALWLASGLYLIIQALVSFGVGGYIAGRLGAAGNGYRFSRSLKRLQRNRLRRSRRDSHFFQMLATSSAYQLSRR